MEKVAHFIQKNLMLWLIASLTLGLAPFGGESGPHIVGKLKWVAGGAKGMKSMDWFDLLLHGTPFIFLIISLVLVLRAKLKAK